MCNHLVHVYCVVLVVCCAFLFHFLFQKGKELERDMLVDTSILCDGLDLQIEQHDGIISGKTGNDSLVIVALLSNSPQMVQMKDILKDGDIVGRFGCGEKWVYRTDAFSRNDGVLYILGVSLLRSCVSNIHYFLPSESSSLETCPTKLDAAVLEDRIVLRFPCDHDVEYSILQSSSKCSSSVYSNAEPILMNGFSLLTLPISPSNFTTGGLCARATCGRCISESLFITPSMIPNHQMQLSSFDHKLHMSTFLPTKHYNMSARIHHSRYYGMNLEGAKKSVYSCRSSQDVLIELLSIKSISRVLFMKVKMLDNAVLHYLILPDGYNTKQVRDVDVAKYGKLVGKCENEVVTIATTDYFEYSWNVVFFAISSNGCVMKMIKRRFLP
ncbi:hypothetical protein WA556_001966, partial [Blastocystis sp. ATCC 50177/Nand II]